jgi:transcriptional regulator with XRE-family HTH domain
MARRSAKSADARSPSPRSTNRRRARARGRATGPQGNVFAQRLKTVMEERGLTSAQTAERVREHLPEGEGFTTANMSHYRSGRSIPRSSHLEALSQALGVEPAELVPANDKSNGSTSQAKKQTRQVRGARASRKQQSNRRRIPITTHRRTSEGSQNALMLELEDLGTEVHIRLDQRFPWDVGMRVIQALKSSV